MIGKIRQKKSYTFSKVELNKQDIYNLQTSIIGFMGILGVIFIHSNNIGAYGLKFENGILSGVIGIIEIVIIKLAAMANSYFFMISGYHFYYGISKEKIKGKLHRRIKTLVLPYLIAVCLSIIYYFMISIIPGLMERLGMPLISWSPQLIVCQVFNPTFDYPLWFANYLIVFSFFSPVLYWIYNKRRLSYIVLVLLISTNIFSLVNNSYYNWLSVYYIGGFIGFNTKEFTNGLSVSKINKPRWLVYVVLFAITIIMVFEEVFNFSDFASRAYMYISPFVIWEIVERKIQRENKIIKIRWWMSITFFVYSYHVFILPVITKIIKMILPNNPITAILNFVVSPLLTYSILIVIAKILKLKPMLWKLINGGRGN